jgi:predicted methyltransferase
MGIRYSQLEALEEGAREVHEAGFDTMLVSVAHILALCDRVRELEGDAADTAERLRDAAWEADTRA